MTTVVAVQARLGSTRLPGKALMNLGGKPLLRRVLDAVAGPWRTIVLTSISQKDDRLAQWLQDEGVEYRRGLEDDVLSRYFELAMELKPDHLVRVCGDAPFLKAEWIKKAVGAHHRVPMPVFVPGALHTGSWMVWDEANKSTEPCDWEHAGYFWFQKHSRHMPLVPPDYFTINTQADLDRARERLGTA